MAMNMYDNLNEIWIRYKNDIPLEIFERRFIYSINEVQKDILITGINPSFRETDDINCNFYNFQNEVIPEIRWDNYWGPLKKILHSDDYSLDYTSICAYLDIFYFREMNQKILSTQILKTTGGLNFIAEQLRLTQQVIEDVIKPKIIIVKNKESAAYWGRYAEKNIYWMGYDFERIKEFPFDFEVYRIKGLLDTPERLLPEKQKTNLIGSIVIFVPHINQYTKKEKKPTAEVISYLMKFL